MTKKRLFIGFICIAIIAATVPALLSVYTNRLPLADDAGSSQEGIKAVAEANNAFAVSLYSEFAKEEQGNLFYSPYSISAALAMTYEGAVGNTADEMRTVLYFPEDAVLRPNFAAIYNQINNNTQENELRTANALWVQHDFPLLPDYTNRIDRYYKGNVTNLDFVHETEKARHTINSYISEQTNNKIEELITEDILSSGTSLILTNAIYFKGTWRWEFDTANTVESDFRVTPTQNVSVPMMHMFPEDEEFNYGDTDEIQILELPYKGDDLSMVFILPRESLNTIGSELTMEKINEYLSIIKPTALDTIALPKFKFDTKYLMEDVLASLGMPTAFDKRANFSGMTGTRNLYIDHVIHQAHIAIDEQGTQAAAATAVSIAKFSALPQNSTVFKADHPFIFLIRDNETKSILFLGKVVDPTK